MKAKYYLRGPSEHDGDKFQKLVDQSKDTLRELKTSKWTRDAQSCKEKDTER